MAESDKKNSDASKPKSRLRPKPAKQKLAGFSGVVRDKIFGCIPDLPDHRDAGFANTVTNLPDHVQLDTPVAVRNQGAIQSCTAFAVTAAVRFAQIKQGLEDYEPSPRYLYFNTRCITGSQNQNVPCAPRDAIKAVVSDGTCMESDFPYVENGFAEHPPQNCYEFGRDNRVVSYQRLPADLASVKGCLASGFPVILAFTVFENFMTIGSDGLIPVASGSAIGGHAVLVIGYDDADRVFMCQNSFGTNFGDQGFLYMSYSYLLQHQFDIWTIVEVQQA